MLPLAVAPMAVMLGGRRPVATTVAFPLGTFLAYTASGVLLALGVDAIGWFLGHPLLHVGERPEG